MIRNLIAHIYPRRAGGHWRRTAERLIDRRELFTGRRIIGIATDDTTDDARDVAAVLSDLAAEIIVQPNDPPWQEVATFRIMLPRIIDEPGATFYCHSKGCTHVDTASASHLWREAMAEICLDSVELIDCALSRFPTCGAFRSVMPFGWGSPWEHPWHWAGTWFWFDNAALRRRNWSAIEPALWGVEAYIGQQFALEESGCLFWPNAATADLYDPDYWHRFITPSLERWRAKLAACGV